MASRELGSHWMLEYEERLLWFVGRLELFSFVGEPREGGDHEIPYRMYLERREFVARRRHITAYEHVHFNSDEHPAQPSASQIMSASQGGRASENTVGELE